MFARFAGTFFSLSLSLSLSLSHVRQAGPFGEREFTERNDSELSDKTGAGKSGVARLHVLIGCSRSVTQISKTHLSPLAMIQLLVLATFKKGAAHHMMYTSATHVGRVQHAAHSQTGIKDNTYGLSLLLSTMFTYLLTFALAFPFCHKISQLKEIKKKEN